MKMIPLSTSSKIQIIGFRSEDIFKTVVYIAPITGKDEIALDNKQSIVVEINGKKYAVSPDKTIFYGDMDFSDNSEDCEVLAESPILNSIVANGVKMPANYDYKNHCCYTPEPYALTWETFRPELITQFKHGMLGKPRKCIIFKRIL